MSLAFVDEPSVPLRISLSSPVSCVPFSSNITTSESSPVLVSERTSVAESTPSNAMLICSNIRPSPAFVAEPSVPSNMILSFESDEPSELFNLNVRISCPSLSTAADVPLKLTIVFDQPINPASADCSLPTNDSWLVPEPDEY